MEYNIEERDLIADHLKQWGHSASIVLLDPSCHIFTSPQVNGFVGYKTTRGCVISFGDPVCSQEERPLLVRAFHQFCDEQKKSIVYVDTTKQFSDWALESVCGLSVEIGQEFIVNPQQDPTTGGTGRILRKKMNQSSKAGVTVQEYISHDPQTELAIEKVGKEWLKARRGLQIFLSHVHLFSVRQGKRWFYAQVGDKMVGALLMNQITDGWVVNLLMTTPDAPNGTSELLVMHVIEILRQEGASFLSFGTTPAKQLGTIHGLGKFSKWTVRKLFNLCKALFHLDGRRSYWEKFQPEGKSSFLLCSRSQIGVREIRAILRGYNVSL